MIAVPVLSTPIATMYTAPIKARSNDVTYGQIGVSVLIGHEPVLL